MNEWRQTVVVVCTMILTAVAVIGTIVTGHSSIRDDLRADMQSAHTAMRADMQSDRAAMRAADEAMRADMQSAHAAIQSELGEMRILLYSIDRRTARIEGHLFGIDLPESESANPDD